MTDETPDDPLAEALTDADPPFDDLDRELADALLDVRVPDGMEDRLEAIPQELAPRGRRAFWIAAAAAVVVAGVGAGVIALRPDPPPKLVAVKFWHTTCPACKKLDPNYAVVVERMRDRPVRFLTLDMSTEASRERSSKMAEELGIKELFDERFGSTGYVIVLDAETHEFITELTAKQDDDEMVGELERALRLATS